MKLVIVNNLTGDKSTNFYNKNLKPYLDTNNCSYDTLFTKINYITSREYNEYIIIGGDGTMSYYVNKYNLYLRNEPILCIPTGSGNGLAKNLNITNKNIFEIYERNNIKRIDLQEISYTNDHLINNSYYSFLFITWGLISDIDIDSEFLRFLGEYRFYYGIIKFLLLGNTTSGKLTYIELNDNEVTIESNFSLFCSSTQKWISNDFNMIPCADENHINIIYIDRNISFFERCRLLYELINETHIENCSFIKFIKVKSYTLEKYDDKSKFVYDGELLETNRINVSKNNSINFYVN